MRALPNLTDLSEQPAVFDQQTDDFVNTFASDFTQTDSLSATAATGQQTVYAGLDPISQAIDAVGGMLSEATDIFSILSGDLDTVNLDPIIENFQAADSALDANLSDLAFDLGDAATILFNAIFSVSYTIGVTFYNELEQSLELLKGFVNYLASLVYSFAGGA